MNSCMHTSLSALLIVLKIPNYMYELNWEYTL